MRSPLASAALALGLALPMALATTLATETPAHACGGCFIPPEDSTVVTDHRMILAVGQGQSTLYDQIRYQGLPQEFAWVLPIAGEADVGLSADLLFSSVGGFTATQIIAPPQNCPARPRCQDEETLAEDGARFADAGAPQASPGGVTVTREENVGPYATVQLQSEDAEALTKWLADNKFTIPNDIKPVIAQYVREHFNFLAMKLRPGTNVQAMRPVRVTTKGPQVVLPLRMVAAGTGPVVGITLWVVGQGRYEPTNFPTFAIKAEDLVWDWTKSESNFKELRAKKTAESAGRAWEVESAFRLPISQIVQPLTMPPPGSSANYAEIPPSGGSPGKTAEQVREEDLDVLFNKTRSGDVLITRMRADLAHAALTEDLVLQASKDQGVFSNVRQVTKELNEPLCPVYKGCKQVGMAPRSQAAAQAEADAKSSCATAPRASDGGVAAVGLAAAFVGLAVARARRRRGA